MLPNRLKTTAKQSVIKILFILVALVIVQIKTPPVTNAQSSGQSPNNTAVFSGQFIPAFVGSAYDPTSAYQRMAGLPVYVYSYDSWGGNAFIINNLAVRTQIRADGSFQAQGLPNGQKFGVYFPFRLESGQIIRSDCNPPNAGYCANSTTGTDVPFRMPQPDNLDGIGDVFSYNLADARTLSNIFNQLGEPVTLGLSFLTQETRVDIANNINTFPLLPTSTIKITTKPADVYGGVNQLDGSAYEFVATRVWFDYATPTISRDLIPGDNLMIKGRTTFPFEAVTNTGTPQRNDRTFMAFAPPGIYAITLWRNEGNTTFDSYGVGKTKLDTTQHGFGVMRVSKDLDMNGVIDNNQDWFDVLDGTYRNDIPILQNKFIMWGRVMQKSGQAFAGPYTGRVELLTNQSFALTDKARLNSGCPSWGPFTFPTITSLTPCAADVNTAGTTYADTTQSGFSVYAFYDVSSTTNYVNPRGAVLEPFLSEPLWDDTPIANEEIISTDGPKQIDIVASDPKDSPNVKGILIPIVKNTGAQYNPNTLLNCHSYYAIVTKEPGDTRDLLLDNIQHYRADGKCTIHIPHAHLVPKEGVSATGQIDPPLNLNILVMGANQTNPQEIPVTYNGLALVRTGNVTLSKYTPSVPDGYKLLGLFPVRNIMPGPERAFAATSYLADVTINFNGAKSYQSITISNHIGGPIFDYSEEFLSDKSGTWVLPLTLALRDPGTACTTGSIMSREVCMKAMEQANTYIISVTADERVLSETFVVRPDTEQGVAVATSSSWNADFRTACDHLEEKLNEEHEKELNANLVEAGWTDVGKKVENLGTKIDFMMRKFETVRIPVVGCRISLGFSNLAAKGLETFRNVLIMEPLTLSAGVLSTWNTIRALANVMFVFVLIIVGINHALGYDIKNWGANVMLPQIILGIIWANLSLLIVQGIMDINNILTAWIFAIILDVLQTTGISANAIAGVGTAGGIVAISSFFSSLISGGIVSTLASLAGTGGTAIVPIVGAILAAALAILGLIISLLGVFYGRYLIIWIMTIAAPIFLMISVLPWFRGMKNMWIKTILPIAFMQTITALLIAIGILLLGKSVDGDSLFIQAGVFLIGGGALYLSIKSQSIAAQFMGGGGLAGQALGALQGLTKGAASFVSQKGAAVSEYSSLENVEARREKRETEKEVAAVRDERLRAANADYRKPVLERLPFGLGNQYGAARVEREAKLSKQLEARGKAAEGAAVGPKFDVLNDTKLQQDPLTEDMSFADAWRGQAQRGKNAAFREKMEPGVKVLARTGFKPLEYSAFKTGADMFANNPNQQMEWGHAAVRDSNGRINEEASAARINSGVAAPPKTFQGFMQELHSNANFTAGLSDDDIKRMSNITSRKEFEKLSGEAQSRIMEEVKHRRAQNIAGNGKTGPDRIMSVNDVFAEGRRRDRQYDELKVQAPPGGGGGGGTPKP